MHVCIHIRTFCPGCRIITTTTSLQRDLSAEDGQASLRKNQKSQDDEEEKSCRAADRESTHNTIPSCSVFYLDFLTTFSEMSKEAKQETQEGSWGNSSVMPSTEKACILECGTSLAEQEYEEKSNDKSFDPADVKMTLEEGIPSEKPISSSLGNLLDGVTDLEDLRERLARDVITQNPSLTTFTSPIEDPTCSNPNQHKFLELPLVYGDQTASNRPVRSIEEYLQRVCLPLYGNTHTNTSITGSQSTALVAEARQLVAEACNAKITGKASLDAVLFA